MWHNLTNHPAHQQDGTPGEGAPKTPKSEPDSKSGTEKKDGEPKKPSDPDSGSK